MPASQVRILLQWGGDTNKAFHGWIRAAAMIVPILKLPDEGRKAQGKNSCETHTSHPLVNYLPLGLGRKLDKLLCPVLRLYLLKKVVFLHMT